ncbi:MAG: OadG family protein [Clostridiales bacterium]|nr:OadG family protein [Clostridiales bacterium]
MTLLERFADPNIINTMSFGDKMIASLYVAILGMGVTFLALFLLWGAIVMLSKFVSGFEKKDKNIKIVKEAPKSKKVVVEDVSKEDNLELVAVIAAAIAFATNQPIDKFFVRNIRRVGDSKAAWKKAGIANQMSQRM